MLSCEPQPCTSVVPLKRTALESQRSRRHPVLEAERGGWKTPPAAMPGVRLVHTCRDHGRWDSQPPPVRGAARQAAAIPHTGYPAHGLFQNSSPGAAGGAVVWRLSPQIRASTTLFREKSLQASRVCLCFVLTAGFVGSWRKFYTRVPSSGYGAQTSAPNRNPNTCQIIIH